VVFVGRKFNFTPEERRRLDRFRQDKFWTEWLNTLHRITRNTYGSHLFRLLGLVGVTSTELVELAGKPETQKELSKRVKLAFAEMGQTHSASARYNALSGLKSLLALNELELPLIGLKIRTQRKVKPLMRKSQSNRSQPLQIPDPLRKVPGNPFFSEYLQCIKSSSISSGTNVPPAMRTLLPHHRRKLVAEAKVTDRTSI
jgi:hypothetical protein